jgi:hypothetical protein
MWPIEGNRRTASSFCGVSLGRLLGVSALCVAKARRYDWDVNARATLAQWLQGARPEHPLLRDIALGGMDEHLDAVEAMLRQLEKVSPMRLAGKRRDFRRLDASARWWDLCSELQLAAWLAMRGVPFEFGAPGSPQPDLVLTDLGFGLEVTRRERRARHDLVMTVFRAVLSVRAEWVNKPRPVIYLTGQPLTIRVRVLQEIHDAVVDSLRAGEREVMAVVRPSCDGLPAMTARIDLHGGRSVVPHVCYTAEAAALAAPMADVEDLVVDCLTDRQKDRQAASMPTALVIDVSRLSDIVWLRTPGMWSRRLPQLLTVDHHFVAVGLMLASLGSPPRMGIGIGPWASASTRTAMIDWAKSMGITYATT